MTKNQTFFDSLMQLTIADFGLLIFCLSVTYPLYVLCYLF